MSKNPLDAFLDVYVDHLLDEPPAEIKVESESKLDSAMELQPILQSESSQESEPIQESEPTARSLNELFAEANERLDSELDSSRSPFFQPIISDDLFAEIEQSDAQYKESSDLPPMMLFETIVPFEEESLDEELIKDEPIELESIEDELVEPESSPSRLPMETRLTDSSFQTLIFEISGVKLAVPLVELGGIHPFVPLQHIIGKPDWYAGFVQLKGKAVNCIDGAKWLLTDKRPSNESTLDYQFIIMLNDTNWGIACHNLVDTVLMFKEEVKWRDTDIKRPWMAGLVKEQMCAMLDTYQLTDMLDAGLSSDQK